MKSVFENSTNQRSFRRERTVIIFSHKKFLLDSNHNQYCHLPVLRSTKRGHMEYYNAKSWEQMNWYDIKDIIIWKCHFKIQWRKWRKVIHLKHYPNKKRKHYHCHYHHYVSFWAKSCTTFWNCDSYLLMIFRQAYDKLFFIYATHKQKHFKTKILSS